MIPEPLQAAFAFIFGCFVPQEGKMDQPGYCHHEFIESYSDGNRHTVTHRSQGQWVVTKNVHDLCIGDTSKDNQGDGHVFMLKRLKFTWGEIVVVKAGESATPMSCWANPRFAR